MSIPDLTVDDARAVLAAQPFSMTIGAQIAEFGDGAAVLEVKRQEGLLQQHGLIHGGVLAYLADNAITFAAGSVLGASVLTASVSVDYLRPAEGDLIATARVIAATERSAVCQCEIVVGDIVCAVAHGTVRRMSPQGQLHERVAASLRHS
jgi:uncharacterized protein (TIGR00369 family)